MKRIYLLLSLIGLLTLACQDDCTQDAYCQLISSQDYGKTIGVAKTTGKTTICHVTSNGNYQTIEVDDTNLQFHLDHGDTIGECGTLSSDSLEFKDGEVVQIPCDYELPFIHVTSNGTQWYYSAPGNIYNN